MIRRLEGRGLRGGFRGGFKEFIDRDRRYRGRAVKYE